MTDAFSLAAQAKQRWVIQPEALDSILEQLRADLDYKAKTRVVIRSSRSRAGVDIALKKIRYGSPAQYYSYGTWHRFNCPRAAKSVHVTPLTMRAADLAQLGAVGYWKQASCCAQESFPELAYAAMFDRYLALDRLIGYGESCQIADLSQVPSGPEAHSLRNHVLGETSALLRLALAIPEENMDEAARRVIALAVHLVEVTPQLLNEEASVDVEARRRLDTQARGALLGSSSNLGEDGTIGFNAPFCSTWSPAYAHVYTGTPPTADRAWKRFVQLTGEPNTLDEVRDAVISAWEYDTMSLTAVTQLPLETSPGGPPDGMSLHDWLTRLWEPCARAWVVDYVQSCADQWAELDSLADTAGDVVVEYQPRNLGTYQTGQVRALSIFPTEVGPDRTRVTLPCAVAELLLSSHANSGGTIRLAAIPGLPEDALQNLSAWWKPAVHTQQVSPITESLVVAVAQLRLAYAE